MAVDVHTYLTDVQSLFTSILSISFWISDKCNMRKDYEFVFLLVVRSIACSTFLYREVAIIVQGS